MTKPNELKEAGHVHHHSFFLRYLKKYLGDKITWKDLGVELYSFISIASPVVGASISTMLINIETIMFVGHLSALYLAAAALSLTVTSVTGLSVIIGLLTAFETLGSQAFGAGNFERVGILLQRCILISFVLAIPIAMSWYFTSDLLLMIGQDEQLATLVREWLVWLFPGIIPWILSTCLTRYLQIQGINMPVLWISAFAAIWNLGAQYLFIFALDLGFTGAPIVTICFFPKFCSYQINHKQSIKSITINQSITNNQS